MRFLKIARQAALNLFLFLVAIGVIHLIGAVGFVAGGPLLALIGYFIGITLMLSVFVWAVDRP